MFDVKFPEWLERFHRIVALADGAATLKARLKQRAPNVFEQHVASQKGEPAPTVVIEGKEEVVPWLDSIASAPDLADGQEALAGVIGPLRKWAAGGFDSNNFWTAMRHLEDAEAALRKLAAAIVSKRSAQERGLAFMSEFYVADQRRTGAIIGAKAQAAELGSDGERMLRLAQECEYGGLLEEVSAASGDWYYRITVAGRKWVEQQVKEALDPPPPDAPPSATTKPSAKLWDGRVDEALQKLNPDLAACYRQAVHDLEDPARESFVGPAAELREVLAWVLRTLAPDEQVIAEPDFVPDAQTNGKPTQRQRVQFIVKTKLKGNAEGQSALPRIESGLDDLTRDLYKRASGKTHLGKTDHDALTTHAMYLTAVLRELLP